jgi:hypothetical protein
MARETERPIRDLMGVTRPAENQQTVEAALMARPCNTPMRGIYGVESVCARPEGHTGKHDSIWNYEDWGGAALRDLVAQAEKERQALVAMVYVHRCQCGDGIPNGACARCRAVQALGFDPARPDGAR